MEKYSFNCSCKRCILTDVLKLQQRKQYKEAYQLLQNAYDHHSKLAQDFKKESEKLQLKLKEIGEPPILESQSTFNINFKHHISSTCTDQSNPNAHCVYGSKPDHSINIRCESKVCCPVAVFEPEDPKRRPMYPKNLVYADGKDTQLEEIRAARYFKGEIKTQACQAEKTEETILENQEAECHLDRLLNNSNTNLPSQDINLPKNISDPGDGIKNFTYQITDCTNPISTPNANNVTRIIKTTPKCSSKTSHLKFAIEDDKNKNLLPPETQSIPKTPLADRNIHQSSNIQENASLSKPTPDKKLAAGETVDVSDALERLHLNPNVTSRLNRRKKSSIWDCPETENEPDEKFSLLFFPREDNKENVFPTRVSHSWKDDNEEDDPCLTKNFNSALASSTPRGRRSRFFSPVQNVNGTFVIEIKKEKEYQRCSEVLHGAQNLSVILERSKERSTSSSGSSVMTIKTGNSQEKALLTAIKETEEKSHVSGSKLNEFDDPFNESLIKEFLENMKFPCEHHLNGFFSTSTNVPAMKLSSIVKLGSGSEKYSIIGEQGKGSYAKIFKAHIANTLKPVALKLQKPACVWEYYISKEIRYRLKSEKKAHYFLNYSNIFVYKNGSILLSEWAPCGSLLNFVSCLRASQHFRTRCPTSVTVCTSIQLVSVIEYLHSCQIIHGDIKPDNFVICLPIASTVPYVKLIDYGRSIDMTLFPEGTVFTKVVSTEDFTCNEMKENKPWTYQTDLYGLAGTIYLLLVGEYMKSVKRNDSTWHLKKPIPRYLQRELWDPIFETLLNHSSHGSLKSLSNIKQTLRRFFEELDPFVTNQQFNQVSSIFKK